MSIPLYLLRGHSQWIALRKDFKYKTDVDTWLYLMARILLHIKLQIVASRICREQQTTVSFVVGKKKISWLDIIKIKRHNKY